jgi:hypothetical protein
VLSLYITLFSAITGVLAKAWLANYASFTKRREADDAYKRYLLDKQVEDWKLKEVITLVPILLQTALFLFLIGLVLRGYGDSPTLSIVLLAFCISGGFIYLTLTLLPLLWPNSPFNTPLSDFFRWVKDYRWESSEPRDLASSINHGLAAVLYEKSIRSPKASHVNAAIEEIALPSFRNRWVRGLCLEDSPTILLARFVQCATSRTHDDAVQNDPVLGNCMLALLRLIKYFEKSMLPSNKYTTNIEQTESLVTQLHKSLGEPGNPLHRWNSLPEEFRPLLFSLRLHSSHLLSLHADHVGSQPDIDFGDFHPNELADQPWYMAWQDIPSQHRIHFTVAASRGALHGQKNTKIVSSMILSLCLARGKSHIFSCLH